MFRRRCPVPPVVMARMSQPQGVTNFVGQIVACHPAWVVKRIAAVQKTAGEKAHCSADVSGNAEAQPTFSLVITLGERQVGDITPGLYGAPGIPLLSLVEASLIGVEGIGNFSLAVPIPVMPLVRVPGELLHGLLLVKRALVDSGRVRIVPAQGLVVVGVASTAGWRVRAVIWLHIREGRPAHIAVRNKRLEKWPEECSRQPFERSQSGLNVRLIGIKGRAEIYSHDGIFRWVLSPFLT
ncbi:hypothetical protein TU79_21655 [Pseudomonas trivialis]|uniref:Uncharacterized protein n=1 Tax=Pseudomonas trivialis TaxID=200450 RepID=A0A0R2ZIX1_9PSED|nr:hypothetical protein TU79_21655 [Pseudomonas trivialis]